LSPSIKIIEELKKKKANVIVFDPHITLMSNVENIKELLRKSKALVLVTNHDEFLNIDPTTRGMLVTSHLLLPGSIRSGQCAKK